MSDALPMAERHAAVLTELAELGLALARKLADRAMKAETAEEERAAALAFHRISRSVRQTLHLEAQLERLRARQLREEIEAAQATGEAARRAESPAARAAREAVVEERKFLVREHLEEAIWMEVADDFRAEALVERLEKIVEAEAEEAGFLTRPIETFVAELRTTLGLKPEPDAIETPAHPREGGDPSGPSDPQPPDNPASAWDPASPGASGADDADPQEGGRWAGTWPNSS